MSRAVRSFLRVSFLLALVGAQSLLGASIASATSDTCLYDGPTKIATVLLPPGPNTNATVSREPSGNHIQYEGTNCGTATVKNTDTVYVITGDGAQGLTIDLSNGAFAPGATSEGSGVSEIEFEVDLGAGTDSLSIVGGSGNDRIWFPGNGAVRLNGDTDADVDLTGVENRYVYGGGGNDTIGASSTTGSVYLYGEGGDDQLTGGGADDTLEGGIGADVLQGGSGSDDVEGDAAGDIVRGGADPDYLYGGAGNDVLDGGPGNDYFYAESGPDGADTWIGGDGQDDYLSFRDRTENLTLDADGKADDGAAGEGDRVGTDIEQMEGGSGNDHLTGTAADNYLYGADGDDVLSGLGGNDYLQGGADDDTLHGGADEDSLYGGMGDDVVYGDAGGDGLNSENVVDGNDEFHGGTGRDQISYYYRTAKVWIRIGGSAEGELVELDSIASDVENATGGGGNDYITGTNANNYLYGYAGADTILGGAGVDGVNGGIGGDDLTGGDGYDYVYGNEDNDVLHLTDGGSDYADCGTGTDVASDRDAVDTTTNGCETI
jgi:Ca2+-binding RTX toxin-like protein